jgi:Ca2+/H+ antiporter
MTDRVLRSELRRFGLLVGGVALIAGAWWRHREMFPRASMAAIIIGAALVVSALLVPASLRPLHRYWMAAAEAMSVVMTRVILFVVFALVVTPVGLMRRAIGADPLRRRSAPAESYWEPYAPRQHDQKHYENMF